MANTKITTRVIADDAITSAQIADNAINSEHYVDGSIDTAHIANGQVTVDKMAANSIDSAQYVDGSIDTAHYADNSITGAELADNIDIAGTLDVTGATTLDSTLSVAGVLTGASLDISGNIDIDGTSNLDVVDIDGAVDMASTLAVAGVLTSASSVINTYLTLKTTDDQANSWVVYTHTNDTLEFNYNGAGNAEVVIAKDGKVGIGTTSPSSQFVVAASNGGKGIETQVTTHASNNQFILAYDRANSAYLNMELSALNFGIATNNGTNRLKILANGNVGIGTSAPAVPLHVFKGESGGVAPNSDSSLVLENSSHTYLQFLTPSNKEQGILFGDAQAANTGQITFSHQSNNMLLNAPGIIELDAGTDIKLDAAGDVIFLDGDSEKWRMQSSTGYLIGQSASQVRLVLGSTGNSSNNTSNWIRGDGTALGLNSGGGTIGFEISGSEKMHIDSAGKIKIGNNIPMWSGQYGGGLFLKGNNSTSDRYAQLCIVDSNGAIAAAGLKVNNNGSITCGGAGDVIITDGNLTVANGHGIDFASAGNASGMSSELLDDYEEGTFTPAINFQNTTNNNAASVNAATGRYTKVGNLVSFVARLNIVVPGSLATDNFKITGLPFASLNVSELMHIYTTSISGVAVGTPLIFKLQPNESQLFLSNIQGTANGGVLLATGNSVEIKVSGVYRA